jgi:hypothetical protein
MREVVEEQARLDKGVLENLNIVIEHGHLNFSYFCTSSHLRMLVDTL